MQAQLQFPTTAPINKVKFTGQNRLIYDHLSVGRSINVYDAIRKYKIFHLHSRISDLRNKHGIIIYDRMIKTKFGECKEYSLKPF